MMDKYLVGRAVAAANRAYRDGDHGALEAQAVHRMLALAKEGEAIKRAMVELLPDELRQQIIARAYDSLDDLADRSAGEIDNRPRGEDETHQ